MLRLIALILALALVPAAPAAADWSDPFDVSDGPPDTDAYREQHAVDPAGVTTVVWQGEEAPGAPALIRARRIAADGTRGPIVDLTPPEVAWWPDVAVDAAGVATVAWEDEGTNEIRARRIDAAGGLGTTIAVTEPGESGRDARVATNATGDAWIAWEDSTGGGVFARRLDAAGVLGDVVRVSPAGQDAVDHEIVVADGGALTVVWRRDDTGTQLIRGRRITAAGAAGPVLELSDPASSALDPAIVIGPGNDRVALWRANEPSGGGTALHARRLMVGSLGPIVVVDDPAAHEAYTPTAAVGQAGDVTFAWEQTGTPKNVVMARRLDAADVLGPLREVSDTTIDATMPSVALDAGGVAHLAWSHLTPSGVATAHARTLAPDGTLGPLEDLSAVGEELGGPVRVAAGADGTLAALWSRDHLIGSSVRAAHLPAPPPDDGDPGDGGDGGNGGGGGAGGGGGGGGESAPGTSAPSAVPPVVAPPACGAVTIRSLTATSRGRTRARTKRRRGLTARLRLSAAARIQITSATATLRLRGRTRTLRLGRPTLDVAADQALRLRLPATPRVAIGTKITLRLTVRARGRASGCAYGAARRLTLRSTAAWIPSA